MDNPNMRLDEDGDYCMEEEEEEGGVAAERIRLRPYYDWRADTSLPHSSLDFPRVNSQVPLSPRTMAGYDDSRSSSVEDPQMYGYRLNLEKEEEEEEEVDNFDDDDDDDDDDEEEDERTRRHQPLKRLPSLRKIPPSKKGGGAGRKGSGKGSLESGGGGGGGGKADERGTWAGRFDFILSLIGYSVGLGNVWRFPYLVYKNGGGAFLIPFLTMMAFVGFPLMFMELAFGQYASLSPVVIFKRFSPLFAGLGYGMIAVSAIVMLYYNLIIAWTLYYLFISMRITELPWTRCDPAWSTDLCYSHKDKEDCLAADPNATYFNRTCWDQFNASRLGITDLVHHSMKKSPSDEYFNNYVLGNIGTLEEMGPIQWHLLASLGAAWLMVFLCLCKGVQSSGKVVYFTALFPYFVLVILFVRGITLPGASEGILFYVKPDFSQLAVAQVWGDAAVQVFFALSPSWGGLITLASYNKFNNNCFRDAIMVLFANAGTSIFSGFVVFSIIGYLAHELEVPVEKVVNEGVGLAFMVYPEVVSRLPISPFWSFMFFLMLITLGLDSQFALLETVQTAVLDRFPRLRHHKFAILVLVSTAGYAGGVIFTTGSGVLWLGLFDKYAANFSVLIIAITECLLISWYYGADRFLRDVEKMIGPRGDRWKWCWTWVWKVVTPATLFFILIFNWIQHEPAREGNYLYPMWADRLGWGLAFIPTVIILLTILYTYLTYKGGRNKTFVQKLNALMQPSENWGPTHRNLERLQRRSISSANQTSRKNSSVRRDPTTTTANTTGTTTSASSSLKLNQSSQQQQQIAQQNNPHPLPFPPPHSILHSARQSNGGALGAHNGAQGGARAHAHANPNLISGSGKTVSIQNGGPTAIISSSGKSVGHLSKAKANRPSPLTMVPPTAATSAATNLPHPPFHPPLGARTSGNGGGGGGDCSSSSSELTTVTPTNLSVKSGGHVVILDGTGGTGGGGGNGGSGGHTPKLPQSQFTTTSLRSSGQGGDTSTPSSSLPSSANPVNSRNRSFDNPFFDGSVQGYRGQQQQPHQGVSRSNSDANKETRI